MLLPPGCKGSGKGMLGAEVCHGGAAVGAPRPPGLGQDQYQGVLSSFPVPLPVLSPTGEFHQHPKELAICLALPVEILEAVLQRWVCVGAENTVTGSLPRQSPHFPFFQRHPGTVLSVSGWRRTALLLRPTPPCVARVHAHSLSMAAERIRALGLRSCCAPGPPRAPTRLLTGPRPRRQKTKPGGEAEKRNRAASRGRSASFPSINKSQPVENKILMERAQKGGSAAAV